MSKRALVSVSDKTGLVPFVEGLVSLGWEIVATGGTQKLLEDSGVKTVGISEVTGFPEILDGRVKTLHPKVHGGLLARRDIPSHMQTLSEQGITPIDLVCVNLYPFRQTIAKEGVTMEDAIENIDIGGPSMLRSAAKNHASVTVVTNPATYDDILAEMRSNDGATTLDTRKKLALEVFRTTSAYDNAIYNWLLGEVEGETDFAQDKRIFLDKQADLRYGENPHQKAAFYKRLNPGAKGGVPASAAHTLANAEQLQGKELSYNNYLDTDSAWSACREFGTEKPTAVIIKHQTPCGIAQADDIVAAYQDAFVCDSVSAFGGVMAFNRPVTEALAKQIVEVNKQFSEVLIAPDFEDGALEVFKAKPNVRLLKTGGMNPAGNDIEVRIVEGGMVVQDLDSVSEDPATFTVPTEAKPSEELMEQLIFAWKVAKSVKSNAVVLTKGTRTVGIGGGQPNRVNSARIAVDQAGEEAKGAVVASDAFLPFPDTLEVVRDAGCVALIQPGGSIRDDLSIEVANAAGMPMVYTGHRHFRH